MQMKPSIWCPGIRASHPLMRGLSHYWPVWGLGEMIMDLAGSKHLREEAYGWPTWVSSQRGPALKCNTLQRLQNTTITASTPLTLWIMSGGYGLYDYAGSFSNGSANAFGLVVASGNILQARVSNTATGAPAFDLDNIPEVTSDVESIWTMTGRFNSTISRDLFINGIWRDNDMTEVADGAVDRYTLGAETSGGNGWQDKLILATAVWNRSLTDGEILSLYEDPWALITPRRKSYFWVAASGGAVGNAWYYNQQQQVVA